MNALVYWGGAEAHTPKETAELLARGLEDCGFDVTVENHLRTLLDPAKLAAYDLIVPVWTMAGEKELTAEHVKNLNEAVKNGAGLGGVHGGMCDSARHSLDYQWMTGGQFWGHPHVGDFAVRVVDDESPIVAGLPAAFPYKSEQYYMAVDPSIDVLAVTDYCFDGEIVEMPVVWTKKWGEGRVFFSSLGHTAKELEGHPQVFEMTLAGLCWATRGFDFEDDEDEEPCGCGCED